MREFGSDSYAARAADFSPNTFGDGSQFEAQKTWDVVGGSALRCFQAPRWVAEIKNKGEAESHGPRISNVLNPIRKYHQLEIHRENADISPRFTPRRCAICWWTSKKSRLPMVPLRPSARMVTSFPGEIPCMEAAKMGAADCWSNRWMVNPEISPWIPAGWIQGNEIASSYLIWSHTLGGISIISYPIKHFTCSETMQVAGEFPRLTIVNTSSKHRAIGVINQLSSDQNPHGNSSGWWFGTFGLFSHILGIIIPIDFHIFQRGGLTTNQSLVKLVNSNTFAASLALQLHGFAPRKVSRNLCWPVVCGRPEEEHISRYPSPKTTVIVKGWHIATQWWKTNRVSDIPPAAQMDM